MKKLLLSFALAAGFLAASPAFAARPGGSLVPGQVGPSTGTTAVLLDTGSGWLYDVRITSAAVSSYTICYDSASATGFNSFTTEGTSSVPQIASVYVSTVAVSQASMGGSAYSLSAVGYSNGLVCVNSTAHRAVIYYREE